MVADDNVASERSFGDVDQLGQSDRSLTESLQRLGVARQLLVEHLVEQFSSCPFTGRSDLRRYAAIRCTGITEPLVIKGYQPVPRRVAGGDRTRRRPQIRT